MKQSKLQLSCSRKLVSKTKVKPPPGGNIIDFGWTIWSIREAWGGDMFGRKWERAANAGDG